MRFLLDENVEQRVAAFLRGEGHDVTAIASDYPASLTDSAVLNLAHTERRILVTNDRDFGELIFKQRLSHCGVIYFRLPLDSTAAEKVAWLQQILATHQADIGKFMVVTARGIRVS